MCWVKIDAAGRDLLGMTVNWEADAMAGVATNQLLTSMTTACVERKDRSRNFESATAEEPLPGVVSEGVFFWSLDRSSFFLLSWGAGGCFL